MIPLIPTRKLNLVLINKKRTCQLRMFPVQAQHKVKIKGSEKIEKYFCNARELRKLRKIGVTVMPIVVGALGTVLKSV